MNNTTHPDTESLLGFLERPEDSEFAALSLHLVTCNLCRNELIEFSSLQQRLCEYKRITNRKQSNREEEKDLLRANLHFTTHSEAMRNGLAARTYASKADSTNESSLVRATHLSNTARTRTTEHSRATLFSHLVAHVQWRPPLWSAFAMTALLLLAVTYNLQFFTSKQPTLNIISYQDNPALTFTSQRDDNPGMGFFNNIQSSTKQFSGVIITQDNSNNIAITWPRIENSRNVTLRLYQLSNGDTQLVDEQEVADNTAKFSLKSLETLGDTTRFEWTLSGITTDNKEFRTRGGFAVARTQ